MLNIKIGLSILTLQPFCPCKQNWPGNRNLQILNFKSSNFAVQRKKR